MDYTDLPSRISARIRGIIFDYGGTLDSHGDHWSHIILDAWRDAGVGLSAEDFIPAYIHGERALALPGAVAPTDTFLDLMRKKIWAESARLNPCPDSRICEKVARACYESARSCTAEAAVMLEKLSRDYPLAVVSNFYGNLDAVLEDFGLRRFFTAVIESAKAGVRKPDPAIFRLGTEALGLPPAEILAIGDSMDKDIIPAAAAGCRTLLIEGRPWPPTSESAAQG